MPSQKLKDLARKITALEERELIYVLGHVLPEYSPHERDPETDRSGLFLGTFLYRLGALKMDIVAYPDPEVYGNDTGPDWGLCQSAPSDINGLEYVSNVKSCLSPFNGRGLHLT